MNTTIARWVTCALWLSGGCGGCGDDALVADTGSGLDATLDAGPVDAGPPDARRDSRFPDAVVELGCGGEACDPMRGCVGGRTCVDEMNTDIGGASDPLVGCADGVVSVPTTSFAGGYCTFLAPIDSGGCDPDDEESCGGVDCARCLSAGQTSTGVPITLCAPTCTPSLTTNPCRDTYQCALGTNVCLPGCGSDLECQVRRADTNGDGVIDPYDATDNPEGDRLKCETEVRAYCDMATGRCRHEGIPGAQAGDPCTDDFECEADGECLVDRGADGGFPGGYCIKRGCDLAGNECAGEGKCQERGFGFPACLAPCEVAATDTADDPFAPSRDCRAGYTCFWDGTSGASTTNGACIPANDNDVRTPNIGASCANESECYSPFGLGQCRDFGAGDHCTLFDCAAPGMPADVCGDAAVCAPVSGSVTSICIATCESAADCREGNGCWDTSVAGIDTGGATVCFPGCLEDGHCLPTQRCVGASMTSVGQCE